MSHSRRASIPLLAIILFEIVLYLPSTQKFYCGDSIFWFSRIIGTWSQVGRLFLSVDDLGQYRPFTPIFYSFVVHPLAGMDVLRQHIFPLVFHILNTLLVFVLSRHVFEERWQALLSTFFFGISATGAYITYDNTFIPDYLFLFLYLTALIALSSFRRTKSLLMYSMAVLFFAASLFSKESGATFPAAACVFLILDRSVRKSGAGSPPEPTGPAVIETVPSKDEVKQILIACLPFAAFVCAYLAWHLMMKGGSLYPSGSAKPHSLDVSISTLQAKIPFFLQALGLPPRKAEGMPAWPFYAAGGLASCSILWMGLCASWGMMRRNAVIIWSVAWILVSVAPALFIIARTWEQNMYLPLVGFAWISAASLGYGRRLIMRLVRGNRWAPVLAALPILIAQTWAAAANACLARNSSWMSYGSRITQNCLTDLQKTHPFIPHDTLIYVETDGEYNLAWHFDSGKLPAIFYGDLTIQMRFSDDGHPPPSDRMILSRRAIVMQYARWHLFDVSLRRRLEIVDKASYRITDHWEQGSVHFGGKVVPAARQTERLVFMDVLALNDSARKALVLSPDVRYVLPLPYIKPGSQLRFGAAVSALRGDGLLAELRLIGPGGEFHLYNGMLSSRIPERSHQWDDRIVPLLGIEGEGYRLEISAHPLQGSRNCFSWLEWSPLEIVPPESQNLEACLIALPPQPIGLSFSPPKVKRGESVTIEVVGGKDMIVDCQYTLNSPGPPVTLFNCFTTDQSGTQTLAVNTPGHYVFSAIRNSLLRDWVPVHQEWDCMK